MRVTVIAVIAVAVGTVPKGLKKGLEELEIEEEIKTIKTTKLWKSARRLEESCCHSNSSENPSADAGVIHPKGV